MFLDQVEFVDYLKSISARSMPPEMIVIISFNQTFNDNTSLNAQSLDRG